MLRTNSGWRARCQARRAREQRPRPSCGRRRRRCARRGACAFEHLEHRAALGQLDGQISYQLTDNFEVFAEAINITKADTSVYLQFPELPFRFESGSRRLYAGVKFNF